MNEGISVTDFIVDKYKWCIAMAAVATAAAVVVQVVARRRIRAPINIAAPRAAILSWLRSNPELAATKLRSLQIARLFFAVAFGTVAARRFIAT